MKKGKLKIGVVFGGRSGEHEVSLVSAKSVIGGLDQKKYEIMPIGISKNGQWIIGDSIRALKNASFNKIKKILPPSDPTQKNLINIDSNGFKKSITKPDVIFPVLHGTFGEDGSMQGFLELADIPYVGAGVLGSALGMDKIVQKLLYQKEGILTPEFIYFNSLDWKNNQHIIKSKIKKMIGWPCFVKPANTGSSVGITKVHNISQIDKAVRLALQYDVRILIEKSIEKSREIEVSVLGNDKPKASFPGEIIASNEFYDYNAKYVDGKSKAIIPAKLPAITIKRVQQTAIKAFKLLNCSGMARVDFLIARNNIYLNEINTIPGFTSISMYPRLWEASGLAYPKLLDKLIQLAIEKHLLKSQLKTSYQPKSKWYKNQ